MIRIPPVTGWKRPLLVVHEIISSSRMTVAKKGCHICAGEERRDARRKIRVRHAREIVMRTKTVKVCISVSKGWWAILRKFQDVPLVEEVIFLEEITVTILVFQMTRKAE